MPPHCPAPSFCDSGDDEPATDTHTAVVDGNKTNKKNLKTCPELPRDVRCVVYVCVVTKTLVHAWSHRVSQSYQIKPNA